MTEPTSGSVLVDGVQPLPHELATIPEILASIRLPEPSFDPNGQWDQHYGVWMVSARRNQPPSAGGRLRIRRAVTDGKPNLFVEQATFFRRGGGEERLEAEIACAADSLSTPVRWQLRSEAFRPDGSAAPYCRATNAGEAAQAERTPVTCTWSLFDAVQRLPFDSETISFDFLDELGVLKRGHRLETGRTATVEIDGSAVRLHGFVQIGEGVLPTTYWVTDNHALLLVTTGIRAFSLGGLPEGAP